MAHHCPLLQLGHNRYSRFNSGVWRHSSIYVHKTRVRSPAEHEPDVVAGTHYVEFQHLGGGGRKIRNLRSLATRNYIKTKPNHS